MTINLKRLDMIQCEKKGLVKLPVWLKTSKNYVDDVMSIKRRVHFCQDFKKPLEQRTPRNARILPKGFLSQERTQGSENMYRGKSDNFQVGQ